MRTAKIQKPSTLPLVDSVLYEGDALTVLQRLPSNSVQCAVTSPPYWGLRDYNNPDQIGLEETLPQFINRLRTVFTELKRVGFDGWISIEDGVDGMDQLARSVGFLKQKIAQYWPGDA